ncbi:hypothetical protein Cgig2_029200 [Carnegiea gigantea]|uniref:RNA helicase n=1 Tax=Carnegiea gigantea TaxID=171969 RepID=A0A9Q1QKK0_9CARY|nr:hypothetical protein Cgig2_029200 [Carnegiea gigantea]
MKEHDIMEAVNQSSCVIIHGETGCGKTTQVPQPTDTSGAEYLDFPPARGAAFELGVNLGNEVGFQVRHDKEIGENCAIKFMTDGILLREIQSDFLLKRYSVVIMDEVHERNSNTDILSAMLSCIIKLRKDLYEDQEQKVLLGEVIAPDSRICPLKVILMSATLCIDKQMSGKIFSAPHRPSDMRIESRQFPVTRHFQNRTCRLHGPCL